MDKRGLPERDIRTTFVTPALRAAGRDEMERARVAVSFTKGRIFVHGKRADDVLHHGQASPSR